ncbi:hypothetical protein F6X40_27940 [Paraburkholderia sp. UCT31]|uniref:hypothetical protein n=1 Tax=Paraburkholderia sp. UCT31 TaxID=2615209 RepID=UPI001655E929|nr:hypothetical protein [Paraburkholderia sp. UCT31]MBC8740472.1 hypothetical protein [Paraburkholderia sp. UCT31]
MSFYEEHQCDSDRATGGEYTVWLSTDRYGDGYSGSTFREAIDAAMAAVGALPAKASQDDIPPGELNFVLSAAKACICVQRPADAVPPPVGADWHAIAEATRIAKAHSRDIALISLRKLEVLEPVERVYLLLAQAMPLPGYGSRACAWEVVSRTGEPVTWLNVSRLAPPDYGGLANDLRVADKAHPENAPHRWRALYSEQLQRRTPSGPQTLEYINSPLHPGVRLPIAVVLNDLVAQEYCEGTPYDEMAQASRYILSLEDALDFVRGASWPKVVEAARVAQRHSRSIDFIEEEGAQTCVPIEQIHALLYYGVLLADRPSAASTTTKEGLDEQRP